MYCTRKSLSPLSFLFLSLYKIKKKKKQPSTICKIRGLRKRNRFLEVELKLYSCLFLVVDAAFFGRAKEAAEWAVLGLAKRERDKMEGEGD